MLTSLDLTTTLTQPNQGACRNVFINLISHSMVRLATRQGVTGGRRFGRAESVATKAQRLNQRREMDYIKEVRQAMNREHQGPSAVDCFQVAQGRSQRETARYESDNAIVGYRVPAKPRDYDSSLAEVLDVLTARQATFRTSKHDAFLRRPEAPTPDSPDYQAFEATRNNFFAQMLASAPRRATHAETTLPRAIMDKYASVKRAKESGDQTLGHTAPYIDGKLVVTQELAGYDDLGVSSPWYQKMDLLRMQMGFATKDKKLINNACWRAISQQGQIKQLDPETVLEIALFERERLVELIQKVISEKDDTKENQVVLDFSTTNCKHSLEYSDGKVKRLFFSTVGMEPSEFGLDGDTSVPMSETVSKLMVDMYRHSVRIAGVGDIGEASHSRIEEKSAWITEQREESLNRRVEEKKIEDNKEDELPEDMDDGYADKKGKKGKETASKRESDDEFLNMFETPLKPPTQKAQKAVANKGKSRKGQRTETA